VAEPPVTFAGLLRKLRTEAGLTQEELASAARLSVRSISDLERGINQTARKDTARLLADALNLTGPAWAEFEAVARGRAPVEEHAPTGAGSGLGTGVAAATRTLPRDIASFTGREPELRELVNAAAGAPGSGGVVGIHAIGGMAGIGKTAFAVHAAYQLAPQFPGGQIFLPLHGHTPGQRPVEPTDALASLLLTTGVPVQQIPPGLEARMALWRDRLAGRQLLLVLDDAADSEQVKPLLPGTGDSLVLVTSRRHLSALEDARAISLDTLPTEEAARLLVRLAARSGLSPDDAAVSEITRLCGYLPLAIGMLARQLHHHPAWAPSELAADLAAARDRLELMQAENLSVTVAFNLSYEDLTEAQQRLFRRLGLHPGTDIDTYAVAALDDTDLAAVRRDLQALYDHYLLGEPARGRYRLHDLISEHARILAIREDADADREAAIRRLLDYYQFTAETADRYLIRYTRPGRAVLAAQSNAAPDLTDGARALSWARTERANLLACLNYANRAGWHARVVALTAAIPALLRHDGPWTDALTCHGIAVQAARYLGNRLAEASALNDLGVVQQLIGNYPDAAETLQEALGIYRDLGNRLGQATALDNIGMVRFRTGQYQSQAGTAEQALGIYRELGDQLGQASALRNLGTARRMTCDFPAAAGPLEEALYISRDIGDRLGQASALSQLGLVGYQIGDYGAAADALQEALGISRDIGDRLGQASALRFLGGVWRQVGDFARAADALEEALGISRDIGDRLGQASALEILGKLHQRTGDYKGAADAVKEALGIARNIGNRMLHANSLSSLGSIRLKTGDLSGAADALEEALGIYRDTGDRGGEVETINMLGTVQRARGDFTQAGAYHQQALDLAREIEGAWDEAHALAGLARCDLAAGRTDEAVTGLREALEIFRRVGAGETADVYAELEALRDEQTDSDA
jgi:tetratricopeptide (TPR) repeat protein/transcriptional regulator with XRE-family HTH domain